MRASLVSVGRWLAAVEYLKPARAREQLPLGHGVRKALFVEPVHGGDSLPKNYRRWARRAP